MTKRLFKSSFIMFSLFGFASLGLSASPSVAETSEEVSLYATIAALDAAMFDAFNHCEEPQQLQEHARYFDPEVEFYHDNGGVTWNRADMLANTEKFVCGHFRRERVEGSLHVFPIKDYGAIVQGSHRFCQFTSDTCDGIADFTMIWRQQDGEWQVTRVLSYGHKANL